MAQEASWLTAIISVLPFVLLLAGFFLYLAIRRWKRMTYENLGRIRQLLRDYNGRIDHYRRVSAGFSADDPDEYGKFAEKFLALLVQTEIDIKNLSRFYVDFTEASRDQGNKKSLTQFLSLPPKPYHLYRESEALLQKMEDISSNMSELEAGKGNLLDFSWIVAQTSKSLLDKVQNSAEILQKLIEAGASGDSVEPTQNLINQWKDTLLTQTPVIFYSPDPMVVRAQASKEETIRVQKMNMVSSPEIDSLRTVIDGWSRAKQERDKAADEIKRLTALSKKIIHELDQRQNLSLKFSKSTVSLTEAEQALAKIFQTDDQYDLEQFELQAKILNEKFVELQTLQRYLTDIRSRCDQLSAMIFSDEIVRSQEILKDAYRKLAEVEKFHFGNYDPGDQVPNLRVDIDRTASLHSKYSRALPVNQIDETDLEEKNSIVEDLFAGIKSFSLRLSNAHTRYLDLLRQLNGLIGELVNFQTWTDELKGIVENNPLLRKDGLKQIEKLDLLVRQAKEDLSDPKTEVFEKRSKRVQQVRTGFQELVARFIGILEKDGRKRSEEVSRQLENLREVALFDDPILIEAEKNLQAASQPGLPPGGNANHLEKLFIDFVAQNNLWTKQFNTFERFFEATNPILRIHQQAQKSRLATAKLIDQIETIFPEDAEAWPPTSQREGNRKIVFRNLETQWNKLKQERVKLESYNQTVIALGGQYDELKTDLAGLVEVVLQEQGKFNELERRLEESKRMWKNVARNYQTNRVIADGVDGLISSIDREVAQLKQQYQQGKINAQYALQRYRTICRKTDEAVVDVDSRQIIDINGTIQTRL